MLDWPHRGHSLFIGTYKEGRYINYAIKEQNNEAICKQEKALMDPLQISLLMLGGFEFE